MQTTQDPGRLFGSFEPDGTGQGARVETQLLPGAAGLIANHLPIPWEERVSGWGPKQAGSRRSNGA